MAELHGLQMGVIRSPLTSPGMLLQALLPMWHQDSDMQSELLRLLREQVVFFGGISKLGPSWRSFNHLK